MTGESLNVKSALAAASMVAACIVAAYLALPKPDPPGPTTIPTECGPDRPCPSDRPVCLEGDCYTRSSGVNEPEVLPTCEVGAECPSVACACRLPQRCNHETNICENTDPDDICGIPAVQRAVDQLYAQCEGRSAQGDPDTCPPDALREYIMKNASFDELISAFPSVFTIHFDYGEPPTRYQQQQEQWLKSRWAFYASQLESYRDALDEAEAVFIVGRASWKSNFSPAARTANERIAVRRAKLIQKMLTDLYKRAGEESAAIEFEEDKSAVFSVGDPERSYDVGMFVRRYSPDRIVTWSQSAYDRIKKVIEESMNVPIDDYQWASQTLNQVAFVIPVPCRPSGAQKAPK